ncbi:MAG: flagellar type III secretion system pore protein FliP [Gammaproteobacteria bacterium]
MCSWIKRNKYIIFFILLSLPLCKLFAADAQSIPFLMAKQTGGTVAYSLSVKILAVMTVLTVLPALLITMSAFTRIIIVLAIVRQGLGIPNVPGNQIIIGLSLIMTLFVMMPVLEKINDTGVQPYLAGKLDEQKAFENSSALLKTFMLKQTRKTDLKVFSELSRVKVNASTDISMLVLMPAFITSELKTAFEIGFLILLPFLIIDLVIASILMSMGMMMLSPMVISLPFKILFFVLVDGWSLIVTSLITSFRI